MINLGIVYYLFNMKGALYFLVANIFIALLILYKQNKYYSTNFNHDEYYAFKRNEKPVSFLRIYFGLISFVYIKFLLMSLTILACYIGILVIKQISKKEKNYLDSQAYLTSMRYCNYINYILVKIAGVFNPKNITLKMNSKIDEIYTKYLGKDYEKSDKTLYPIIICNHIGWLDIFF